MVFTAVGGYFATVLPWVLARRQTLPKCLESAVLLLCDYSVLRFAVQPKATLTKHGTKHIANRMGSRSFSQKRPSMGVRVRRATTF